MQADWNTLSPPEKWAALSPERQKRVAERIRKLKRTASRFDPGEDHEADSARRFARMLELEYGIDVVEEAEAENPERPSIETRYVEVEPKPIWWRSILMADIAPGYGCQSISTRGVEEMWFLYLVGPPDQVQRCAVHYEYLVGVVLQAARTVPDDPFYPRSRWREGVCCGALQSLIDRLHGSGLGKIDPVKFEVEVSVHNEKALVPTWIPERVESEEDEGPHIRNQLPTVEIDPPQPALEKGYRAAKPYSPRAPAICFGAIEALGVRRATAQALREAGISRIYDLMRKRPKQLRALPGIGKQRYFEILTALAEHGVELRPDW